MVRPGAMAASATPRKNLVAKRPLALWETAVSIKMAPQMRLYGQLKLISCGNMDLVLILTM